jgi:hypothetical protein
MIWHHITAHGHGFNMVCHEHRAWRVLPLPTTLSTLLSSADQRTSTRDDDEVEFHYCAGHAASNVARS